MSELLKNQKFGVEVEFTGITRAMAAKAIQEIVGGSISGPRHDAYYTMVITDSQCRKWKVMRDSSISPIKKSRKRKHGRIQSGIRDASFVLFRYRDFTKYNKKIQRNWRCSSFKLRNSHSY